MKRKIIKIDEDKCNGCGLCASACHEGAIDIIKGKAKLVRENFCDGFGDCLPSCPQGAISFEEREAPSYDEEAVKKAKECSYTSCIGEKPRVMDKRRFPINNVKVPSQLSMWPVQLKLSPADGDIFRDKDLLIASDCTAYAYGNIHNEFIKGRTVLIGCPKLDREDYSEKLTEIFKYNSLKSVTLLIMEVPCCSRMYSFVSEALKASGKNIPLNVYEISLEGKAEKWN